MIFALGTPPQLPAGSKAEQRETNGVREEGCVEKDGKPLSLDIKFKPKVFDAQWPDRDLERYPEEIFVGSRLRSPRSTTVRATTCIAFADFQFRPCEDIVQDDHLHLGFSRNDRETGRQLEHNRQCYRHSSWPARKKPCPACFGSAFPTGTQTRSWPHSLWRLVPQESAVASLDTQI